jgi:hypothetical protein
VREAMNECGSEEGQPIVKCRNCMLLSRRVLELGWKKVESWHRPPVFSAKMKYLGLAYIFEFISYLPTVFKNRVHIIR